MAGNRDGDDDSKDKELSGRTILIAMDGSKHSNYAFQWFVQNMYRETDKLILAFCADNDSFTTTEVLGNPETVSVILEEHESRVKEVFDSIEEFVGRFKIPYKLVRLADPPGECLIKASRDQHVDLIVCGSRGHGSLRRALLGSVSDYVIHHSSVPVIVCKQ